MQQPKLFPYGIQLERSDIRVHVAPATRRLYVFKTAEAQRLLSERGADFAIASARQPGVPYVTALGALVPYDAIPDLRIVELPETRPWWDKFKPEHSTSDKGRMAVAVVLWALRHAWVPLWWSAATESESHSLQRTGTDILLYGRWRIQIKCDWPAGPVELGGSGNLFFQQAELNPRKRH